jgi:hypothetical protein
MTWSIYVLKDPRTLEVRYVGATSRPDKRLRDHIKGARLKAKTHKDHWLRQLLTHDLKPVFEVVANPTGDWETAEREWIARFRARGCRLTNSTDGGEGLRNPTAEVRAKMSKLKTGMKMSAAHRANTSAAVRRRGKHSAETCAKQSAAMIGKKMPRAGVEKQAAKVRGLKRTPEQCQKMSLAQRGKPKPKPVGFGLLLTKLRLCPTCSVELGALAMRQHKPNCPNKPLPAPRPPLSAETKARISAGNTGKRRKNHDPTDRRCWCMDCRTARRGRPNGHPRTIPHVIEGRCRCVDCRKKAKGHAIKLRPCSWCSEPFGGAAMRKHVVACPNKPARRVGKGWRHSPEARRRMAASARRRIWKGTRNGNNGQFVSEAAA